MKAVLTTLALIVSFACIADPVMRTEHKRAPLKGKVKTVRSYGLVTLNEAEVRVRGKDFYSVDSFNEIGKKVYSYYVSEGVYDGGTRYKYDKKGNLVEEYNDAIESKYIKRKIYKYNTSGRLTQEQWLWSDQNLIYLRKKYTYASGLLVTREDSNSQGVYRTDYSYNDKGQVILETNHHPVWEGSTTTYTYYDNGNIQSETEKYSIGDYKTTYTYDEYNNEILAEEQVEDGPVRRRFTSEYIYDSHGNWIRVIEDFPSDYANSPAKQMFIREIEYY
ncbi:MAG TPA: hypothetical protein VIN07_11145 [Flavipsychrobacter sp.]